MLVSTWYEGGRVLYSGKNAGISSRPPRCSATTRPRPTRSARHSRSADPRRCLILFGSTSSDLQNDVLEYWFGSYLLNGGAGVNTGSGDIFNVLGTDTPFTSLQLMFSGADSAPRTKAPRTRSSRRAASCPSTTTRSSRVGSRRGTTGRAGLSPYHTGELRVLADRRRLLQAADAVDQRPAGDPAPLRFWASYNTEPAWDHMFVEAVDAAGNRTTLPSAFTTTSTGDSSPAAGRSCTRGSRSTRAPTARGPSGTPPPATPRGGRNG